MNKIARFLTLSVLLTATTWLAACSTPPVIPNPKPVVAISQEQRHCVARCVNNNTRCGYQSNKIYQQCAISTKRLAKLNYDAYVSARLNANKKVIRSPNSFLDLSQCQQHPTCSTNYKQCYASCGL